MKAVFGFLTSRETYASDLPADLDPTPVATSTIVTAGIANSIQLTPAKYIAPLHAELQRRPDLEVSGTGAEVYERTADPALLVAFWPVSWGAITTQTTVALDGPAVLSQILRSVTVSEDARRVPRVAMSGGVTAGNRRDPIQRDSVRFLGKDPTLWYAIEFDDTQGLGTSGQTIAADVTFVTSTQPFGVSVTCSGPNDRIDDLTAILQSITSSTEPV